MGAYTDITLTDELAASNTMEAISVVAEKSIRRDFSKDRATPFSMTHSHQTNGSGTAKVDRHLVRLDEIVADTDIDDVAVISQSCYMVWEVPQRVFTEAQVLSLTEKLASYAVATIADVLKGKL